KRVIYAEGEDERVLRAAQTIVDEHIAFPVLVGREHVIRTRIQSLGLRLKPGETIEIIDGRSNHAQRDVEQDYYELMKRRGVSLVMARDQMRNRMTLIASMYLRRGYVDAMLCGMGGTFDEHLTHVQNVIGTRPGTSTLAAMNMLMLPDRQLFICDTYVNRNPTAEQLVEMTLLAAEEVRRFGLVPSVALLSHSSFGSSTAFDAQTMRDAVALLAQRAPGLEVDGEMRGDAALSRAVLKEVMPDTRLRREANLLMMPNVDAANIAYNLLKAAASNGITVGPILLGAAKPAHILEPTASVRRIVNMTALSVVDAAAASQ
ncbi:MAG: phosphate acyltransferase, partial [Hyphomicrobium sp.]